MRFLGTIDFLEKPPAENRFREGIQRSSARFSSILSDLLETGVSDFEFWDSVSSKVKSGFTELCFLWRIFLKTKIN